jgi:hypothetical protein
LAYSVERRRNGSGVGDQLWFMQGFLEYVFSPRGQDYTKGSWTKYKHQLSHHCRQPEAIDDFMGLIQQILQQ